MISALWAILYNLNDPLLASKIFQGVRDAVPKPQQYIISRLFRVEMEDTFLFTLRFMSRLFILIPISVDFQRYTFTNLTPASYCEHIWLLFHWGITGMPSRNGGLNGTYWCYV